MLRISTCAKFAFAAVAGIMSFSARSEGQTCVGGASYSSGPVRIGAGLEVQDQAKSYGAALGLGSPVGPFGSVSLSRTEYDNIENASNTLGVTGGYAVDINPPKTVQFCPVAGFAYMNGPTIASTFGDIDVSAHAVSFGGAIGGVATSTPTFAFVPYGGASYVISRATASLAGTSGSDSQDYTLVEIGAGFVINHTLTIRPAALVPVGLNGGKTSFDISVSFNFGSSSAK
jgi:hypothetical protein